jgi:opacity protein-like surface antigen
MKKVTLALAAVCCATFMNAQDGKAVRFGLKVAPNIGWIKPDDKNLSSSGTEVGFNFGLMGDFRMGNDNYAFSTGLMYMTKVGGSVEYTDPLGISTTKSTMKLAYVQLPITLKLKTNEIGYMTYFGMIGIENGLNVGAKADVETTVLGVSASEIDMDIADRVALYRAALLVGAGFEYNFSGNTSAMLGLTYSNGFTNVNKSSYEENGVDVDLPKAKLHYFELSLGVFF